MNYRKHTVILDGHCRPYWLRDKLNDKNLSKWCIWNGTSYENSMEVPAIGSNEVPAIGSNGEISEDTLLMPYYEFVGISLSFVI